MIKNTASQKVGAQMIAASDGSAFTSSVTVAVTVDAGTQATGSVGSGACTHEGNGYHTYAPAQAETNGDLIAFTFTGTGAVPQTVQVYTRAATPDVNVTLIEGSDATNQIRDAVVDDATRIDASALNTLSGHDPGETIMGATDLGTGSGLTSLATAAALSTVSGKIDTVDDYIDSEVAAIKAVTDKLDDTLEDQGGGTYGFTEEALQEAPGGGGGGTTDWDATERAQIRKRLGLDGTTNSPSATPDLATQASVDDVESKVDDLETRLTSTRAGYLDNLSAGAVATASALSTVSGKIDTVDDFLDTEIAAIKAKTDNLPSDPADASDIASSFSTVNTKLDTIDDFLDAEVAAIKAQTDKLTFDGSNAVEANVVKVNDTALTGNGSESTPWGPDA